MKGLNDFKESNVYIVITWLAPPKYAELNVLGQWLESETIFQDFQQDQINQAVGRNRGFRQSDEPTKTVIVTSSALWRLFLYKCRDSRVQLYLSDEKIAN
jgi:hypothetical protein